ncbi:F-box/LRR-repeat protein 4 [Nymphaea thermarum]|nr:F-box/LRR-repeat protein 4 [Nymphaea thermarum]
MDSLLCDELLQQILQRLPSSSDVNSASLVCKRWLSLRRSYTTSLSLRLPLPANGSSLSSLLSHYPGLSTLTLISDAPNSDHLLADRALVSVSSVCRNLSHLRFLVGPVTASALQHLSSSCKSLLFLKIVAYRSVDFWWLAGFPALRELSVRFLDYSEDGSSSDPSFDCPGDPGLGLESVCLTGIGSGNVGIDWIWRNCKKITKLQLCSCGGIGNPLSDSSFLSMLSGIREIELITCRSITRNLLFLVAEHCRSLDSLVLYDGGDKEALLQVIRRCRSLRKIDLRLPLDFDDDGLVAIAHSCSGLRSLCLRSCGLVSGGSLRSLARDLTSGTLEELVLVNCDAVERDPGLLTLLGQRFKGLRKLDLSYNEALLDGEVGSMLASCRNLTEIRLGGCKGLTDSTISSIVNNCRALQIVDIDHCHKVTAEGVGLLLQIPTLKQIVVEQRKIPPHVNPNSRILQQPGASSCGQSPIWSPTDSVPECQRRGNRRHATPILWTDR